MIKQATSIMHSLPKKEGVHPLISPRQIITDIPLRVAHKNIRQYIQGHTTGSNSKEKKSWYILCIYERQTMAMST